MNNCYNVTGRVFFRLLVIPLVLILSSCAAPTIVDTAPSQFEEIESSFLIESEIEFLDEIAGKQLNLVSDSVNASLVSESDGTASGSLVREGGETLAMQLDWVWENASYCRTGMNGASEIERKCESVRLFSGVGILLTYIDTDDPKEYWLFE